MSKKKFLLDALKYIFFFGVGIILFIWVYRGQDLGNIWEGLSRFHYGWIGASFIAFLFSHLFRAMRWRMLIESIGYKPGLVNTFLSILVMYLANYAFPRLGEVTRCGILKRYEGVPFTSQLGTVLVERIVDVLFLLIMLACILVLNWDILSTLISPEKGISGTKISFLQSPLFLVFIGLMILTTLILFVFRKRLMNLPFTVKLLSYAGKFTDGLKSVFRLRQPIGFVMLTAVIYGCYYLGTLFVFKAFAPTASLSPMVALSVLALGSIGMVLPVPGGIGTFHYFAFNTVILYGVSIPDGQLVTLVLHGSTTMFVIIIGAIALGILPIVNKRREIA
ncbi:MAG: lysylphosphatidylglycerol synthase transmembrane domain-containing protein [Bacteroidales bacterium]